MMTEEVVVGVFILGLLADAPRFFFLILTSNFLSKVSCGPFPTLTIALLIVCVLLLQDLLQSCSRGGGRRVEDMCYERRRAEACVD